ncbi:hypothetical protein ACXYMU_08050 [Pontibacter sp. CAU 1760]
MRPEDIDKLFKERLGNTSPTPPADLWNKLQEKMQAPAPDEGAKLLPFQPAQGDHRKTTWLYSSLAAAVSLVLSVGIVFYNLQTGTPELNEALTKQNPALELEEKPTPASPETITSPATEEALLAETEKESENKSDLQATVAPVTPSKETKAPTEALAAVKQKPTPTQPKARKGALAIHTQPAALASTVSGKQNLKPEPRPAATATAVAKADVSLSAAPVEITIIRSAAPGENAQEVAVASAEPGNKRQLAKNIFKQVRNLATGQEVELSEIGIKADKVALNTQIGNKNYSKVINL